MSLFEAQTAQLHGIVAQARARALELVADGLAQPRERAGLILQSEALCELGHPGGISALSLLYTNQKGQDGAFLIGKSLSEIKGRSVDFALAVVLCGEKLDAENFYQFTLRFPQLADHPNWMVKTDKTNIWVRVGREASENALELAASTLIERIHAAFETVQAVELYFVIDDASLASELKSMAADTHKVLREVKTGVWKERGFDYESCELSGHCGSCSDKKTCASIRKIQAKVNLVRRNKQKENADAQQ